MDRSIYHIADTKDRVALQVVSDYVEVLKAQGIHEVALRKLELTRKNLHEMEIKVEGGKMPEARIPELKAQLGQDELTVKDALAEIRRTMKILLLDMGIVDKDSIQVVEPQSPDGMGIFPEDKSLGWTTPAVKMAEAELADAEWDIKIARAMYFPQLSFSVGYSNAYYYNLDKELRPLNPPFGDQLRSNGRTYFGLNLSIPILDRGMRSTELRKARIRRNMVANTLTKKRMEEEKGRSLAEIDYTKAREQLTVATESATYADEALDYATIEYEGGRLSSYDYELAKDKRAEAHAALVKATYDHLLKSIVQRYYRTGVVLP